MAKARSEVAIEDSWNLDDLYLSLKEWETDLQQTTDSTQRPRWPQIQKWRGKLYEGEHAVKESLETILDISRKLSKLYTWAHLKHDEDITNDTYKKAYITVFSLINELQQETAWFEPELISLNEEQIDSLLKSELLSNYRFHLEKTLRLKKYTLSAEHEELLALTGKALDASHKAFRALNDADFKFGTVLDGKGEEKELTHGSFSLFLRDQDRTLRKNAFLAMHGKFKNFENTVCELLNGEVQSHLLNTRARKYDSCLQASLYPKNVDTQVYHALIDAVHENIHALHKYVKLRKKILKLESLHLYDMYVPLTKAVDIRKGYEEAEDLVIDAVSALGKDYQNTLREGLQEQRWVDRYENENKRSGAYSSGCYDSHPYILMNYKGILRDVFTLAHEAGHSMHSYLSHKHQPYQYSSYPIFLAEVASTFNEDLLMRLLVDNCSNKEEKIFLINEKIEDIRATLFRQTMFAEFELFLHESAENDLPLTPALLNKKYRELNQFYFGDEVTIDEEAEREWARIPHFYYNFYVYQYATGISAALALAEKVTNGGEKEREDYLSFLKSGCSKYPIETLKSAGVDMLSVEPVKAAINKFSSLVDELGNLLEEIIT